MYSMALRTVPVHILDLHAPGHSCLRPRLTRCRLECSSCMLTSWDLQADSTLVHRDSEGGLHAMAAVADGR